MRRSILLAAVLLALAASTAWGQSAPTCSFDSGTATLTVTVDGLTGRVHAADNGSILLNSTPCAGATTTSVDTILVNGGGLGDAVELVGNFAPGLTPEASGTSEIEIFPALGGGSDDLTVGLTRGADTVLFTAGGLDVGGDLDEDIPVAGIETVRVNGNLGDDFLDASAYAGGGAVNLQGSRDDDTLIGSAQDDVLGGGSGADTLRGGAGDDRLLGGLGDDAVFGEAGVDLILTGGNSDGNDTFSGGSERDTLSYARRTADLTVTIGNGLADDGQNNLEQDNVGADVENVITGSGDDVLVGSGENNRLTGGAGADEIYGGAGNDKLYGGDGADVLVGDAGSDGLYGEGGFDSLDGGLGNDRLWGGIGSDTLDGGAGIDQFFGEDGNDVFFNEDGVAETVDCGGGVLDDPEPSATDTFIGCELI